MSSWTETAKDLRVWFGLVAGVAVTSLSVLGFAGQVLESPAMALRAQEKADSAYTIASQNRDFQYDLRVAFCTKDGFLSDHGRAQLECWRIKEGRR